MRLKPELVELSSDSSSSSSATTAAAKASAIAARSLPLSGRQARRGGIRAVANPGRDPRAAANPSSGPRNLFSCSCQAGSILKYEIWAPEYQHPRPQYID